MEQCAICLQEIKNDIGAFVPCGHCIHVNCYKEYLTNHRRKSGITGTIRHGSNYYYGDRIIDTSLPRCPLCLSNSTYFQRLYLSISNDDHGHDDTIPLTVPSSASSTVIDNSVHHHSLFETNRNWIEDQSWTNRHYPSLDHLHYVAKVQHQTMLIQHQVNIVQSQIADLNATNDRMSR